MSHVRGMLHLMELSGLLTQEELKPATARELLATYELILRELRDRNVVRTNDAPAGQYAEWLAHRVLGGELANNAVKSYDLITPSFGKVQVKARVMRAGKSKERQLSPFRSFDFDHALVLLFADDYSVLEAVLLPADLVQANAVYREHVNGHVCFARPELMKQGIDVTILMNAGGPAS